MSVHSRKWCRETLIAVLAGLLLAGPAGASDDWDWGAVEAEADAPVTRTPVAGAAVQSTGDVAQRRPAVAEPDYDAEPVIALALFGDLPAFDVVPSKRDTDIHPCSNCHQWVSSNPEPRQLQSPHDNFELKHGLHGHGEFWCFTCHRDDRKLGLKTLEGRPVEFEHAYVVCSQCHARQARDWALGLHGKRVGNWQGRRQVLNCTACHYQHSPALAPREALPGPVMRAGLPRPAHWIAGRAGNHHAEAPPWEREIAPQDAASSHAAPAGTAATTTERNDDES